MTRHTTCHISTSPRTRAQSRSRHAAESTARCHVRYRRAIPVSRNRHYRVAYAVLSGRARSETESITVKLQNSSSKLIRSASRASHVPVSRIMSPGDTAHSHTGGPADRPAENANNSRRASKPHIFSTRDRNALHTHPRPSDHGGCQNTHMPTQVSGLEHNVGIPGAADSKQIIGRRALGRFLGSQLSLLCHRLLFPREHVLLFLVLRTF